MSGRDRGNVRAFERRAVPDAQSGGLLERTSDEAYLTSVPGAQYAVFFPDGGSVEFDLRETSDPFALR